MILDLVPAIGIVGAGILYLRAVSTRRRTVSTWRVAAFYAGLVAATLAMYASVGSLAEATFSGHMIQHVVLMSVAAPLIVLGDAGRSLRIAAPVPVVRAISSVPRRVRLGLRNASVVAASYVILLWAWHLPTLYELALHDAALHALEHVSFFGTSLLVWSVAFGRRRTRAPVALLVVFVTSLAGAALGAIIVFAGSVLYPTHAAIAPSMGIDPLVDQQLAGAIMWIPPGVVSLVAMIALTVRILGDPCPATVAGDR